jgi:hypothetical protein
MKKSPVHSVFPKRGGNPMEKSPFEKRGIKGDLPPTLTLKHYSMLLVFHPLNIFL